MRNSHILFLVLFSGLYCTTEQRVHSIKPIQFTLWNQNLKDSIGVFWEVDTSFLPIPSGGSCWNDSKKCLSLGNRSIQLVFSYFVIPKSKVKSLQQAAADQRLKIIDAYPEYKLKEPMFLSIKQLQGVVIEFEKESIKKLWYYGIAHETYSGFIITITSRNDEQPLDILLQVLKSIEVKKRH